MPLFATQIITTLYHVDENADAARGLGNLMDDALREYTERWGLIEATVSQPYTRSITAICADNMDLINARERAIALARAERERLEVDHD